MWIADGWKDYEVLDTSGGEKLERWGDYLLVRPDPQVIWNTKKENPGWKKKNSISSRSDFLPEIKHLQNPQKPMKCWIRPAEKNWSGGEITFW